MQGEITKELYSKLSSKNMEMHNEGIDKQMCEAIKHGNKKVC